MIRRLAAERVQWMRTQAWQILNRPRGSRPLSKQEQLDDWQRHLAEPQKMLAEYQQQIQVWGEDLATLHLLEWDASMRRKQAPGEEGE